MIKIGPYLRHLEAQVRPFDCLAADFSWCLLFPRAWDSPSNTATSLWVALSPQLLRIWKWAPRALARIEYSTTSPSWPQL